MKIDELVKQRVVKLKMAMLAFPLVATILLGVAVWLLTLLTNPNANPDAKTPTIITAIILMCLALAFFLTWLLLVPKLLKKAEKNLEEYLKMKELYETQNANTNDSESTH